VSGINHLTVPLQVAKTDLPIPLTVTLTCVGGEMKSVMSFVMHFEAQLSIAMRNESELYVWSHNADA
jgi:hypothetical protein